MIFKNVTLSTDIALKNECIPVSLLDNKDMATIYINGLWEWYDSYGKKAGSSVNSSIVLEDGYVARWNGNWKWNSTKDQMDPIACSGDFSYVLPPKNHISAASFLDITTDTALKETIWAPTSGMEVKDGKVVKYVGNKTASECISTSFLKRSYFGYLDSNVVKAEDVAKFQTSFLTSTRQIEQKNVTASTTKYTAYVYPSQYGELTSIVQDNAYQVLGAFKR